MAKRSQKFSTNISITKGFGAEVAVTSLKAGKQGELETTADIKHGDIVELKGFKNSTINGDYIAEIVGGKIMLNGKDLSSITEPIDVTDATVAIAEMTGFCAATNLNIDVFTSEEVDETTVCDDAAQTSVITKPGSATHNILYKDGDETLILLEKYGIGDTEFVVKYQSRESKSMVFYKAKVSSFSYGTEVNGNYTGSVNFKLNSFAIRLDGSPHE